MEQFATVASRLECTLGRCAEAPDVAAIHHVRTGSRRLDAALDALEQETCEPAAVRKGAARLRKLLKKMRGRAGRVRDIDVHQGLLGKMRQHENSGDLLKEIAVLDATLAERRERRAAKFQQRAGHWREKLAQRAGNLLEAAREAGHPPLGTAAAELALESFAALCRKMPTLDMENLHAFRKGTKHARYIAEAGDDDWSRRTAKRLKRVQDAIGMWHDWLVLARDARKAANGQQTELVKRIEARRNRQLESAMRTAGRVTQELLREWKNSPGSKRPQGETAGLVERMPLPEGRKTA